ncbi:outer membrane lipoprotein carrier protein LolA [Streptomyces sp. NPDC048111]|uniref:LolA family protein n=1 Tax=Streptomyces sp. NPDC048111 TaxID=3365500 RepID=UPI0037153156
MAPNDSAQATGEATDPGAGRRKAARYLVPVAVAGVAAATIGLVPALAAAGDPSLPKISAQQLIEKMAASDTQQLSGTVKISTDLGLPGLGSLGSFAPKGGGAEKSASPDAKLTELASGTHTLRVAADGPDRQKVSIMEDAAEYSLIHNGDDVWAYDSGANQVHHSRHAADGAREHGKKTPEAGIPTTPKALADEFLKNVDPTTAVSVDGTAQIAGRDAYELLIKPKQSGSTIGSVRVAVDAKTGVPLKFTLSPSAGGKAVVDAGFTKVDFSKPSASTFAFTPPKGAKVTEDDGKRGDHGKQTFKPEQGLPGGLGSFGDAKNTKVIGKGWTAIAELDTGGKGLPKADGNKGGDAQKFLDSLGDKVSGPFGSGTVFKTRLVNALITDNGKVYVGAVTKDALVAAANSAK